MNSATSILAYHLYRILRKVPRQLRHLGRQSTPSLSVSDYWEDRYRAGGTSGSGSYGRLAQWKAIILNNLVERNGILRVLELGCGDGNQLSFSTYPQYVGLDISAAVVAMCRQRFRDRNWRFYVFSPQKSMMLRLSLIRKWSSRSMLFFI